jgi:hypothetical protein
MTRYFDIAGLISFACMVVAGYLLLTLGPLP